MAERNARQIEGSLNRAFDTIKHSAMGMLSALGVGLSVDAFKNMIQGALDAEVALGRIGERAGLTGAQLSTMARAALLSETSLDDVASMSARLSKALLTFGDDALKSTQILKALGITSAQIPALLADPSQAVLAFAKNINDLPEGGTKAGAQLLALGRAGGTTSAFLKELAASGELVVTRTNEEIAAAKEFNDKMVDMGIRSSNLKTALANALLPTLNDVVVAMTNLTTGTGGAKDMIDRLAKEGQIESWAHGAATAIAFLVDRVIDVVRHFTLLDAYIDLLVAKSNSPSYKPFGSLGFSPEEAAKAEANLETVMSRFTAAQKAYVKGITENSTQAQDALAKQFAISDGIKPPDSRQNADRAVDSAAAAAKAAADKAARVQAALNSAARGTGDDPTKKLLEADLKALDAVIAEEQQTLKARQEFLTMYYQDGYIGLKDYTDKRQQVLTDGIAAEVAAYTEEETKIKAFIANASGKNAAKDRAEGEIKLIEVIKKRNQTEQAAATDSIKFWFEDQRAAEAYRHTVAELSASMLDFQHQTAAAAALRFDTQNEDAIRRFKANNDQVALDTIAHLREQTVAQAAINQLQTANGFILGDMANEQAKINLATTYGTTTELEGLRQTGDLNKSRIAILQKVADAYQAIADATQDPAALVAVDALKGKIAELAATSDLVAKKFNDIFAGAFSSALVDLVTGVKSFKDAVKDMATSITKSISEIAAKGISTQLFGDGGPLSFLGKAAGDLFGGAAGGTGSAAGAAALSGAGALLTTSGTTLAVAGAALSASAAALSAAAAVMGASSASSGVGSIFGSALDGMAQGGGLAGGTDFWRGGPVLVGERGPEIVSLPRSSRVIPNHRLGGTTIINQTVMPGANTQTARQAANMMRDRAASAMWRG